MIWAGIAEIFENLPFSSRQALARPNIVLWIPTRLKAAQLFRMPPFEKVG